MTSSRKRIIVGAWLGHSGSIFCSQSLRGRSAPERRGRLGQSPNVRTRPCCPGDHAALLPVFDREGKSIGHLMNVNYLLIILKMCHVYE